MTPPTETPDRLLEVAGLFGSAFVALIVPADWSGASDPDPSATTATAASRPGLDGESASAAHGAR